MEFTINERKALQKLCFSDTDVYTDAFFKHFYTGDNATDLTRDEKLAATLYVKKRAFFIMERVIPFEFITGLCVRPEYRRRGLSSELLKKYLNETGTPFAVLHPFETKFYAKRGFVPFNYVREDTLKGTGTGLIAERVRNPERIRIYLKTSFQAKAERSLLHPCVAERLQDRLAEIMTELEEGADFLILNTQDEKYCGYALVENGEILDYYLNGECHLNDDLHLKDFHLNDAPELKGLRYRHAELKNGETFNMARAVNIEALLYAIPYAVKQKQTMDFVIRDDLIPQNNGVYRVVAERFTAKGVIRRNNSFGLPVLTAEELTLLALGQTKRVNRPELTPYFFDYTIRDFSQY